MRYLELEKLGHVRAKRYPNGLAVLKYTNKAFFDNLFAKLPELVFYRGLVVDENNHAKVVMRPFNKVFNYLENDAGRDIPEGMFVRKVQKLNGFMAQVTRYNEEYITGTTGTIDSEYAKLARKVIREQATPGTFNPNSNYTWIFEICDPSDPHIVDEEAGAYLIGMRHNLSGNSLPEWKLDEIAQECGFRRPYHEVVTFGEALEQRKTCLHEGYMIQDLDGKVICKMKSFHYLAKKAFMRMGNNRVSVMYNSPEQFKRQIDEEYHKLVDYIVRTIDPETYVAANAEQRRELFERFFDTQEAF